VEERQALLLAEKASMSGGDVEATETVAPHDGEA
jgi:DNA-directed RNA polymerase subunit beta'